MTYNDLIAELPGIMMAQNRTMTEAAVLQQIVRDAEDEIIERIDHDAFRDRLAARTLPAGVSELDLSAEPRRVLEVRAIQVEIDGELYPMERREIERLYAIYRGSGEGPPRFYSEDDTPLLLRVFPTPDIAYPVRVSANIEPLRLGPDIQQSVLTYSYPRLLRMAVRKHAAMYMRNPTDEQRYAAAADGALMEANTQLARRRRDETGVTSASTANRTG